MQKITLEGGEISNILERRKIDIMRLLSSLLQSIVQRNMKPILRLEVKREEYYM